MDSGMDVWTQQWLYGLRYGCMDSGMDVWTQVWMYGLRYGCMDSGMDVVGKGFLRPGNLFIIPLMAFSIFPLA